jgi:type IV fimbrial biogenesis protein FimT
MDVMIKHHNGFTLVELLITLAVTIVLLTLGLPSMQSFLDSARLVDAAEQLQSHLQQARIESIARSTDIHVNISANGSPWVYGISHRNLCDTTQATPAGANACVLVVDDGDKSFDPGADLVLMRFDSSDHAGVSASGGNIQITFSSLRGTSSGGTIDLTSAGGRKLTISVGLLGRINICYAQDSALPVTGYKECT